MQLWTVVGYYDNSDLVYVEHVEAQDGEEAIKTATRIVNHPDLVIVGAIEGQHALVTPNHDDGMTAIAWDIQPPSVVITGRD